MTANGSKAKTYNILFTSLYEAGKGLPVRYYCVKEGEENRYTDALLTAEATTKYLLSSVHIDMIYVLGTFLTSKDSDSVKPFDIGSGRTFYNTDIRILSAENLFRYRLAQFRDDLFLDLKNDDNPIPQNEQKRIEEFAAVFFNNHTESGKYEKFNRFFDRLASDPALYDELKQKMIETFPDARGKEAAYLKQIRNYLFLELRDFSKLSILKENENAEIKFISAMNEQGNLSVDVMLEAAKHFMAEGKENINIYVAMNSDDMEENLIMLGVLNILDMLNGEQIEIKRVCTPTEAFIHLSGLIRESTETYDVTSMIAAVKTFLNYGKADMIVECWENSGSRNKQIEQMVYAMKRIDTGLSLCSIQDLEKGISTLQELFKTGIDVSVDDPVSTLFVLMSEGIRKDYGRLVTSDESGFIDRIRWAYSKGFYQACLTLIEAKAPEAFVSQGIFYYCNDESQKEYVKEFFARKRMQMKSYEYWKMDNIDHYFVKNYFRYRYPSNTTEHQRENAKTLVSCIDNTDPNFITGYTACDNRQLLEDLLFSYIRIGTIRNDTNHAGSDYDEPDTLFPDEKGDSIKLRTITECIQYFIERFDMVSENVCGKNPSVVKITGFEVKAAARVLEEKEKSQNRLQEN